jgi:hypothetical protein
MSVELKMSLNEGLYLREPQDSKLGRKIVEYSIILIDEFGFESFTFKKLTRRKHPYTVISRTSICCFFIWSIGIGSG